MKKVFYFLMVNAVIVSSAFQNLSAQEITNQETAKNSTLPSFQLLLSGNLGYVPNSSMDKAVKSYGDFTAIELNAVNIGDPFKGEDKKSVLGAGADLEGRFFLGSIGFGLSAGYQYGGESKSTAKASGYASEKYLSLTLTAISYLGTAYYRHVINETSFLLLGVGGGYYQGTMKLTEEAKKFLNNNFKNKIDFKGNALGGHIKLEYNRMLGSAALFGGVMGRYVNIDKFKKNGIALTSNGSNIEGGFSGLLLYCGAGMNF